MKNCCKTGGCKTEFDKSAVKKDAEASAKKCCAPKKEAKGPGCGCC